MTQARRMSEKHPSGAAVDIDALVEYKVVCVECAQACTACGDVSASMSRTGRSDPLYKA